MNLKAPDELTEKLFRQQKRELAILNAIIQTLSSSYNLRETLESALEIILSVVGSSTGWICLLQDDQSCSAFVGQKGLCLTSPGGEPTPCLIQCVCSKVRRTGDVVVVRRLAPGCPLLLDSAEADKKITGHVSVPLTTKARIVGQLNVAFHDAHQADEMDIDLLKAIAPQLAVAVENARLWEEVQEKEALRKELLKKLVSAQEEERRRISRELHDELGQGLTSVLVRLQVVEKFDENPRCAEIISSLKGTTTEMLTFIHDLAVELRPAVLDDLGLAPALAQYARSCPAFLGIQVDLDVIGAVEHRGAVSSRLPREVETTLYRIIQEALTNVARHAGVKCANVLLKINEKSVLAIIEDHGVGFDPKDQHANQAKTNRLGLYGMQERVALVGGALTIESAPGAGTSIHVEIPLT